MQKNGVFSQEENHTLFISWGNLCLKHKTETHFFHIQYVFLHKKQGNNLKASHFPVLYLHYNILYCLKLSDPLQAAPLPRL